jgi:hypothetical protein
MSTFRIISSGKILRGTIGAGVCATEEMLADALIKGLARDMY